MTTLLRYDVTTDPFPLKASPSTGGAVTATLTIVASNPNPSQPVTLQGLSVTIPVGAAADDLTSSAEDVGTSAPDGWALADTKHGSGTVEYVFLPQAGQGSVGGQGLAFAFDNLSLNAIPGTCQVTVKEGSAGNPTAQLAVTKFPAGWGEVSFWADPAIIPAGGATTLHWNGPAGATYTIEYYTPQTGIVNVPAQGQPAMSNSGEYPPQGGAPLGLAQTTTFYLYVTGTFEGQTYGAQKSETVTVETSAPSICSFTSDPPHAYTYSASGQNKLPPQPVSVELSWTTQNANGCELSGVPQMLLANTSLPQQISQTTTFTLTAHGDANPPAVRPLTVPCTVFADITAQLSSDNLTSACDLTYTVNCEVPADCTVTLAIKLFNQTTPFQTIVNESSETQSVSENGEQNLPRWDNAAALIITCTGSINFVLTCPLQPIVGDD